MAHNFSFNFRGLTFTVDGTHLFVGDREITSRDFLDFVQGRISLSDAETVVDFVIDTSGASGLDSNGGDFDILREAVIATGLADTLADRSADFSVFAPTDAAFIQLARDLGADVADGDEGAALTGIVNALTELGGSAEAGLNLLRDVLLYHVAPEGRTLQELQNDGTIGTALGASFTVNGTELIDNDPDIANPMVAIQNISVGNGIIQGIDRVLLPLDIPGAEPERDNIVEIAAGNPDFSILVRALTAANLVETVQNATDITVFAPTNAAFGQLAVDLGFQGNTGDEDAVFNFLVGALTDLGGGDPIPVLTDILLYHVSGGAKSAEEIDALDTVDTLLAGATFGSEGTALIDNEPDVENPNIVIPDIAAENGTVQAIDRVLLPIDLPGNETDQFIRGTRNDDALFGGGGDDVIFGSLGNDTLVGNNGDDTLAGGSGHDDLDGGAGRDVLSGGRGGDMLEGGAGNDRMFGGNGTDVLLGGEGNDLLLGGGGHDTLVGGTGNDRMIGGAGSDTFDFTELSGTDRVFDFTDRDVLVFSQAEFADFHALEAAISTTRGGTLIEGEAGTVLLRGVNEHDLSADDFMFA